MSKLRQTIVALAALLSVSLNARSEVIIQYFETRWDEMYQRLPEIAEIGYESIWTPPPGKSPIGGPYPFAYGGNVGYNSFDRFDLGDMPQRGNWETRYGSRTSLRNMVDNAHQADIKIYPDIVFNHTGNGPDYRTYPGLVPQDFHVWVDGSQPGGFKRAPRMFQWSPDNGAGGTLHQELVSLMDLVLEFDNRFQTGGWASQGYAVDPTPFVRHAGDTEKYPYYNSTGTPTENSREFNVRWINWLGYAMDYDGVRLDAPKHVAKEFFGLPKDTSNYSKSFIYNIQKNFNERRGFSDSDLYDDMYSNDVRRDDALVFSEFFIGSIGEVDYWRNPADRGWGIQTRYLNFPLKSGMMRDAFNNGNLGTLASLGVSFDPTEAVNFVQSHDEAPLNKLELSYAYLLTHVGVPVVYFSGNNLKDSEIGRAPGKNTWMNKGYDGALGDFGMGAIPNLIYIHNQFARGKEYTRWGENDFFAFERYHDTNNNGSPDSGEGLLLTVLNDSGSDQTRSGIQTSFAPGTALKDYTGKNPNTVYVDSTGKVNITVGGWWGQGYGCWAPYNADGPASGSPITFSGTGVGTMPWVVPGGRDAAAKPRTITKLTGNSATIDIFYRNPSQGGETVNNVLVKWGKGLNVGSTPFGGNDPVSYGFAQATKIADGHYQLVADLTYVPEGLHTVKARVFNARTNNKPALFQTFTTTVYVDRRGPNLEFVNLNEGETVEGARVVTINNPDRTLYNLTYKIDGGADQQADMVIRGQWRISLDGLSAGSRTITLNATEADYGASRSVINTSTLSRSFTVDADGPAISINHANGATIGEPFFKTVITVPTGQGITANDIKLYWDGYEQIGLTENPVGSGKFEATFDGRYKQGGVDKLFTGAFVNGPHFFEAVVTKNGQENRVARRVVFNLFGQNMHDSDGDGLPDEIELSGFLNGTNPGPDQAWPGDSSLDLIPNFGESWSKLNAMNADTDYVGSWDGDVDSDGDGVTNLQEVVKGYRISGNPYAYNIYDRNSVPPSSVGSYATSTLSMSNGTKYVTITYRPNDGPLSGAGSVTVNIAPVGGGSSASFAMTPTADGFTYTYEVPAGVTSVSYTFSNGATTDNTGGSSWAASTSAAFVMDGVFDSQNFLVADNGMRIYAAVRGNKLYTATWSPKGGVNDHAIYITDQFGNPIGVGAASGTDSAGNYPSWANGSNQGTGFGAWSIITSGSGSGVFIGDPSAAGIGGMSSSSFGLYAKGGVGSLVKAIRPLTTALAVGDSISFQWGINWDGGNGDAGKKGFNIWAGGTFLLNVENRGSNSIYVGGTDSGIGYGTQVMTWSITRTADNTLSVRATGRDGTTFSRDVTVSAAAPSQVEFYAENLKGDGTPSDNDKRQPYINDLKIYRNWATAKSGRIYGNFSGVAGSKPWIFATPTVANQYGFGASGRNWMGNNGQALESEVDLVEVFGSVPKTIFIAVGAYGGGGIGSLLSQAPAVFGNSSNDIEIPEYQPLNTDSIRDEDLDGKFDVGTPEMIVSVNGNETDGNYGLRRFYLDEVAGDSSELTVKFKPNATGSVSNVEVFTNLNRRDYAVLEEDPATVTTSSTDTYFKAYAMSGPDANGYYTATLPVNLCGAYRLQVRYKVSGVNSNNYIYYTDHAQRRDCAVVVSPKKALTLNMYEVNPLVVEAKDTTKEGRSTFLDLVESGSRDGRPDALNQGHYSAQGINMLWLQPIHPIGIDGRDTDPSTSAPFDPGSPYAVRDYWSINPVLGRSETAENALSEFQTFVSNLDSWGVGVMMDGTFNHSSPDAVMGQGAVDLIIPGASASQEIRAFNPGWYAKEGYPAQPAANAGEIAIAPDRNDFGNWTDVREFYFGDYDALVKEKGTQNADKSYPDNAYKLAFLLERDEFAGHTATTRQVWNYFAYYPLYWLDKTGNPAGTPKNQSYKGIDGLRCDFAQGLPSQFWEYAINKTRSRKWDFIFMAESLDGYREVNGSKRHGVGYRSARHFDVLNENIVFYWRDTFFGYPANGGEGSVKNPATYDTMKAYDDRRNAFDNVTLLNNLVSHDEVFPHNDVWSIAYGYAQVGAMDGIPMLMYGQEAGAQNSATGYSASVKNFGPIDAANNFGKYEQNFGKNIPNFKVWNHMSSIWNSRTADDWKLQAFYGRINKARIAAPALQSQNVYFLNQKIAGGGYASGMFAVGKVKNIGATVGSAGQSVVFAFGNNNYRANSTVAAMFDLNATVPGGSANYFGIERGHKYNVKDLLADNPNAFVWPADRTGADLIDNGLYVGLPNTAPASGSYQAQYLQLVDVTAPTITFLSQLATYQDVVTLAATNTANAAVTYSLVGGDTGKVTLNGNQLTINSGTGSVTVRATVAGTADYAEATADAVITFQKKAQTISGFVLNPATADVSQGTYALPGTASSGLALVYTSSDTSVASASGSTLTLKKAGNITITASQPGNDNYSPVESAALAFTVTGQAAPSFESEFPDQDPLSDIDHDGVSALAEYGLGGTSTGNDRGLLPKITAGSKLTITAVVRTNDPRLTVVAQSSNNLGASWSGTTILGTRDDNQNEVAAGFERRIYTIDASAESKTFIRLRFTLAPAE